MSQRKARLNSGLVVKPESPRRQPWSSAHGITDIPKDRINMKVLSLKLNEADTRKFNVKVIYKMKELLSITIPPTNPGAEPPAKHVGEGAMRINPADFEELAQIANCALLIRVKPLAYENVNEMEEEEENYKNRSHSKSLASSMLSCSFGPSAMQLKTVQSQYLSQIWGDQSDIGCCNVDILPLYTGTDKICVMKRLEPRLLPNILYRQSFDNLPLITMQLTMRRNEKNAVHHQRIAAANWMQVTLIGAFNMSVPYNSSYTYVGATKIVTSKNETLKSPDLQQRYSSTVTFIKGKEISKKFKYNHFFPNWESLKQDELFFVRSDETNRFNIQDITNKHDIDLKKHLSQLPNLFAVRWASFHRTLMFGAESEQWFSKQITKYAWPLEIHAYDETGAGLSLMGFLDLRPLLYPGEKRLILAVPLNWYDSATMMKMCNCSNLFDIKETVAATSGHKTKKGTASTSRGKRDSVPEIVLPERTGKDDTDAFVLIEVRLMRPLVKIAIPPRVSEVERYRMLENMFEMCRPRNFTGRGQNIRDWNNFVKRAVRTLQKVPQQGMTDLCVFSQQLSEKRAYVELFTSMWMESAIYVNNNFVAQEFLHSEDTFQEMLLIAHATLMKTTTDLVLEIDKNRTSDTIIAARNARQLQDKQHALELYMMEIVERPFSPINWREMSTCLRNMKLDWARVCIDRAFLLNPRRPLTLLAKATMVFEESPDDAEIFMLGMLGLFPFWDNAWVIAHAYFNHQELYYLAETTLDLLNISKAEDLIDNTIEPPRAWKHELGEWWDPAPTPTGIVHQLFDAADLLLRLRAIQMAEILLAKILIEDGMSACYHHYMALCSRLRGDVGNALCILQKALDTHGNINYLRSLQAECYHTKKDIVNAIASFKNCSVVITPCSKLLSLPSVDPGLVRGILLDLLRQQPSAYAWMALANDWLVRAGVDSHGEGDPTTQTPAKTCAVACATQALKIDRRAARAWELLSKYAKPHQRRVHCWNMAIACGYPLSDEDAPERWFGDSRCREYGVQIGECRCEMCRPLSLSMESILSESNEDVSLS